MELHYTSTRNSDVRVTASQAILKGLAPDGGLFVPESLPSLHASMEEIKEMTYQETAYEVMKQFLTDFTEEELKTCINRAYDSKFDTEEIAPLVKVDDTYYLELFHGATIAFKDMALSILPHLLTMSAKKNQAEDEIVILTATSGDTGKAAMSGFADVKGTKIIVFYPKNGVSKVQELQMVTQKGSNVDVVAIHGNFDQAQSGVKAMFEDQELAEELHARGYRFSSANSINIGRLVPQIVYYVYAYARLLKYEEIEEGEQINIVVPTGNFGNILAAYYAKQMGVPIDRLVCASNTNKVLFDFFQSGTYDKNRDFVLTSSPSMDILISSNLERLIYLASGEDADETKRLMEELKAAGCYTVSPKMQEMLSDFEAGYTDEEGTKETIRNVYKRTGYVMDTHTAVASHVCEEYKRKSGDMKKCVIASTASPYKFVHSVMEALEGSMEEGDELELLPKLQEASGTEMPQAVKDILDARILHHIECDVEQMKNTVKQILGVEA
ncbi:MAG: threonine synthase [Lachnospiraceae bacterium]